jgi:site-specific DNA recombinase
MKRAIAYTRVSTEDQAKHGISLENQTERIRAYCQYKGFDVVAEIEDAGISGGVNKGREGFIQLLNLVESGKADVIVLYSLERLSRDMLTLLALERLLDEYTVELHTVDGQIDTSTPSGWMTFAMHAFTGELERRNIKHRTKRAMEHKKSNGHLTGAVCYGYSEKSVDVPGRDKPLKVLEPYEPEQAVIDIVNSMYQDGSRLVEIVAHLNSEGILTREHKPWTPQQVKRLISGYEGCFKKRRTRISAATRHFIEAIA